MSHLPLLRATIATAACLLWTACSKPASTSTRSTPDQRPHKTGVLLVSHGSHSAAWRHLLTEVEKKNRAAILEGGAIADVKSAFMEYTEPSIATRLKEFDNEGFTDIVVVPVLLSVSAHSFDDIPVIAGQRNDPATLERLKLEKIQVYRPQASLTFTPLLDFERVLEKNVVRRAREMSKDPANEGLVLVAYGDQEYNKEWEEMLDRVAADVKKETGIQAYRRAWCGHLVRYSTAPTEEAIRGVLAEKPRALVVPILVAYDEMFQKGIIGTAVAKFPAEKMAYRHDSILPDVGVDQWVISVSRTYAEKIQQKTAAR